jgi:membrane protein DedA with SNARE-associated domain
MAEFFIGSGSYIGIAFVLILTGAGLPIPEEVPVAIAGILSANGKMDPAGAFAACLIGAILGDTVMYWIGHHFGRGILRKQGWWARVIHPEREAKIERAIQDHGLKVLFFSRFVVGLRAPIYLAAGILKVPYRRFLLMDTICATCVVGFFFIISYLFGQTIVDKIYNFECAAGGIIALCIVIAIVWWKIVQKKARKYDLNGDAESVEQTVDTDEPINDDQANSNGAEKSDESND